MTGWDAAPIARWLLHDGRHSARLGMLVQALGQQLVNAGVPLARLRLSMRTLHPLVTGYSILWDRGRHDFEDIQTPHGLETRPAYIGSPLAEVARTGMPYRRRLTRELTTSDHQVLHDLKAQGTTDYLAQPMAFSGGSSATLVFTTDRASGFADSDIAGFEDIALVMAPIAEVFSLRGTALAVASAYLGRRTGERVLGGRITRGDVETIEAAILISDIRDWTGLSNRHDLTTLVAMANHYFEIVDDAVSAEGGEILKLIGDSVLAVFPTDSSVSAGDACERALLAARASLRMARERTVDVPPAFGIGLHFGQVLYGNVGSKTRLDFTVMGQAVNIASRIEGLCHRLDHRLLFSQEFAGRLKEAATLVSNEQLKGLAAPIAILTASEA